MASNRTSFWLSVGIVAAVAIALWVVQATLVKSVPGSIGSTISHNTRGTAGLFALTDALGLDPVRRYAPAVDDLGPKVAQYWLIAPAEPLQPGEAEALNAWIARGGTLLVFAKSGLSLPMGTQAMSGFQLPQSIEPFLGQGEIWSEDLHGALANALVPLESLADVPEEVPVTAGQELMALPAYPVNAQHPLAAGIRTLPAIPSPSGTGWGLGVLQQRALGGAQEAGLWEPIWGSQAGSLMVVRKVGLGQVIACSQTEWVSNALMGSPGPRELAARLLMARTRDGSTVFSEFHHGRHGELRGWKALAQVPWGRAVIWWLVVMVVGMVSAGWRFVAVPPIAAPAAPDPAGYSEALGHLYARAGAVQNIHYNLANFYQRRARSARGQDGRGSAEGRARAIGAAQKLGQVDPQRRSIKAILAALRDPNR